jgi:hypothetical protein
MNSENEIPHKPFTGFPEKRVQPEAVELTWIASEPIVVISFFEKAGYWVSQSIKYTKTTVFLLRILVELLRIIQLEKEKNMGVLRIIYKVIKWVGVAVGAGGFAAGLINPETAALIAGGSYVLTDILYFVADYLDDKKLNKSVDKETLEPNKTP